MKKTEIKPKVKEAAEIVLEAVGIEARFRENFMTGNFTVEYLNHDIKSRQREVVYKRQLVMAALGNFFDFTNYKDNAVNVGEDNHRVAVVATDIEENAIGIDGSKLQD